MRFPRPISLSLAPLCCVFLAGYGPLEEILPGVASINGTGGCTYPTVEDAVAAASIGDTIHVKPGTYVIEDLVIDKSLTILSSNSVCDTQTVKQVTFEGDNVVRMFTVDDALVQFKALTIRNNDVAVRGPLLYLYNGSVALYNVDVRDGVGTAGGCVAMYAGSGLTMLDGSTISSCEATWGGGVYVDEGAIVALAGTSIHHNTATSEGGGLYLNYGDTHLYGDVTDNSADSDGGGIYAHGRPTTENPPVSTTSYVRLSGELARNSAGGDGGGVYFDRPASTLTLTDGAAVEDNSAVDGGGLKLVRGTTNLLDAVTVSGNDASGDGGGIWAGAGLDLSFTWIPAVVNLDGDDVGDIEISDNTAGGNGGGMALYTPDVDAHFVSLIDNVATGNGGGVFAADPHALSGTLSFRNTRFIRNQGKHGGGLLAQEVTAEVGSDFDTCDTALLAKDRYCSEFRKNVADATVGAGGGLAVRADGSVTVDGASFFQNTGDRGLAVGVGGTGSNVLLKNALVWDHAAGTSALRAESGADLDVRSSTLVDNGVPAEWATGTTGALHRSIVLFNSGTLGAGGLPGNCNLLDTSTAPTGADNAFMASGAPSLFQTSHPRTKWMPKAGSAPVDACGTGPTVDLDGTTRAQGADYDRGAFERP